MTSGRAGGLPFAGPSKGPIRKRYKNPNGYLIQSYGRSGTLDFSTKLEGISVDYKGIFPEMSNSVSPPGRAGGLPYGIIWTQYQTINCSVTGILL